MAEMNYLKHLSQIEAELPSLNATQVFAFAAACSERQWPVYERASLHRRWSRADALRRALDEVWRWLMLERRRPQGFAAQCEAAILEKIEDDDANAASRIATSFFGLLKGIETDRQDVCAQVADWNLSFIEDFVYELLDLPVNAKSDSLVERHDLMQAELVRQREDLAVLRRGHPLPVVIEQVRVRSHGVSILGAYWFTSRRGDA